MSSVIKVDQIQLANGSTPTAADLGLNVNGTVVQVVRNYGTGGSGTTSTSWTEVAANVTITPKFSDSILLVTFHGTAYCGTSGHVGKFTITRDGIRVGNGSDNSISQLKAESTASYQPSSLQTFVTSGSTASTTFKVAVKSSTSGYQTFFPAGSVDQWTATVLEIAG